MHGRRRACSVIEYRMPLELQPRSARDVRIIAVARAVDLLRQRERSMRQQRIAELKAAGEEDKLRELLPRKTRYRDSDG